MDKCKSLFLIATVAIATVAHAKVEVISIEHDSRFEKLEHSLEAIKKTNVFQQVENQQQEIQQLKGRLDLLEQQLNVIQVKNNKE